MFDITEIKVIAGKGGNGAITFRREKFVPFGGPEGGDGGKGGDVILQADSSVMNLWGFKKKGLYKAEDGGDGKAQKKHGKNGDALVLKVPEGTVKVQLTVLEPAVPVVIATLQPVSVSCPTSVASAEAAPVPVPKAA